LVSFQLLISLAEGVNGIVVKPEVIIVIIGGGSFSSGDIVAKANHAAGLVLTVGDDGIVHLPLVAGELGTIGVLGVLTPGVHSGERVVGLVGGELAVDLAPVEWLHAGPGESTGLAGDTLVVGPGFHHCGFVGSRGGDAFAFLNSVEGVLSDVVAGANIGDENSKVDPGRGMPVGPVVTLLSAFKTIALGIGFLAGLGSSSVVADVLIGSEESLIPLPGPTFLVVVLGLVVAVGLHLAGVAFAVVAIEAAPLSSIGQVEGGAVFLSSVGILACLGSRVSIGAGASKSIVEIVLVVIGVGLVSTRASERLSVSESVFLVGSGELGKSPIAAELENVHAMNSLWVVGIILHLSSVSAVVLSVEFNNHYGSSVEDHLLVADSIAASGIVLGIPAAISIVAVVGFLVTAVVGPARRVQVDVSKGDEGEGEEEGEDGGELHLLFSS